MKVIRAKARIACGIEWQFEEKLSVKTCKAFFNVPRDESKVALTRYGRAAWGRGGPDGGRVRAQIKYKPNGEHVTGGQ